MTPRLTAGLWCLLLVAITTIPSNVSARNVDALASALEDVSATVKVPSGASVKDDAAVLDNRVKMDEVEDCSKDGTCDTGDLYDGFKGGKREKDDGVASASTVYTTGGNNFVENDDEEEYDDKYDEDGDDETGWDDTEDDEEEEECFDNNEECDEWESMGECEENPGFMLRNCRKACMTCGDVEMDFGEVQRIDADRADQVQERIDAAHDYVKNVVAKDPQLRKVLEGCKLRHQDCAFWAVLGECEANPNYMKMHCAPVCRSCDQLAIEARCPIDLERMPNAWGPGDLNVFFTNITTLESYQKFEPNVLSRPTYLPGDTKESADYQVGPWVVVLENVVSQEEAEIMIELGRVEGYERSADVGKLKFDGTHDSNVNDGRTSTNAWCQHDCYENETARRVIERVTNITNIPEENSEYLQLLKYEVGQHYQTHHDYIPYQRERQSGVRMITVFLYLNDVEEGGGTDFPDLGLTVQPKRGRVVIWPSVLNEAPDKKDDRTEHQALPVVTGVKYGANAWIHQRDFKTPLTLGCG